MEKSILRRQMDYIARGGSTHIANPEPLAKRLAEDAAYLEGKGFSIGSIRTARRRVIDLERLCAEAYQIIGALCLDESTVPILDNLSAAANGREMPHKSCLPYSGPVDPVHRQAGSEAAVAHPASVSFKEMDHG